MMRNDDGNVLVSVVLVSMVVGALAALGLSTGRQADWSSTSDRNSEVALAVAEAGVHQAISTINGQAGVSGDGDPCHVFNLGVGDTAPADCFTDEMPQGTYDVRVSRTATGFVLDAEARTGEEILGRSRRIRVTLVPPELSPGAHYALFSEEALDLKNNDNVDGDVWANGAITLDKTVVNGSVTSGLHSIAFKNGVSVSGNMWSGGFDSVTGRAIDLAGISVGGWVKASAPTPDCPNPPEDPSRYTVDLGGGTVAGNVTTLGTVTGGTGYGSKNEGVCTTSPGLKDAPVFTFNENNYDQATLHKFTSVEDFETNYFNANKTVMTGTFVIDEPAPSQADGHYVDLGGAQIVGDTTIVTNAPVDTNGIDEGNDEQKIFVVVSRYRPPTSSVCNDQGGDCAIHAKNHFQPNEDGTCTTVVLLYADGVPPQTGGPIAMKNNAKMCGTVIGSGIHLKNNLELAWDPRLSRIIGFGAQTFEVSRWEDIPIR